jgi:Trypsin
MLTYNGGINGGTIRGIKLPRPNDVLDSGTDVFVTGWGEVGDGNVSEKLRGIYIKTVKQSFCKTLVGDKTLTDRMFCARRNGKNACKVSEVCLKFLICLKFL